MNKSAMKLVSHVYLESTYQFLEAQLVGHVLLGLINQIIAVQTASYVRLADFLRHLVHLVVLYASLDDIDHQLEVQIVNFVVKEHIKIQPNKRTASIVLQVSSQAH
jgi:hypothetical protein